MDISDDLVTGYCARYPGLFPDGEGLVSLAAKVQDTRKPGKRCSQVESATVHKKRRQ